MVRTPQEQQFAAMDNIARKHATTLYDSAVSKLQTDPAMTNTRDPNNRSVDHAQLTKPLDNFINDTSTTANSAQTDANRAQNTADKALSTANNIVIPTSTRLALTGANQHYHTISFTPFINLPRIERLQRLMDRLDLERLIESGELEPVQKILAKNTLNSLRQMQDYTEFDAFERERRFDDPEWSWWTENYKRTFGVDEYAEAHRHEYMDYGEVRMDPYCGIAPH